MKIVPCHSCGTKNRLPAFHLKGSPRCGRCGAGLRESALQRAIRGAYLLTMVLVGAVRGRRGAQSLEAGPALGSSPRVDTPPATSVVAPVLDPPRASAEEELELRLRRVILDAGARQRLLDAKQARHPELPRATLIQLILEEYERDRR